MDRQLRTPTFSRQLIVRLVVLQATISVALGSAVRGQDRVTLRSGNLGGRISIGGSIDDCTGNELRIRSADGTVRSYPASDILSIETPQTEAHDRGLTLLAENEVAEALRELDVALRKEMRTWVRREILALQVRGALRQGDYPLATARFLALWKSDPATRHFGLIPLAWSVEPRSAAALNEARAWIAGSSEPAQLIGASLLLDSPEFGNAARNVLRQLSTSTDRRIQVLAQFQSWRGDVAAGEVNELQIVRWQERVDELPSTLQAGPCYLLGRAYAGRSDFEMAAASFLWLPLVNDQDFRLSARACLEAGEALARIGQKQEAEGLFRETVRRFATSPAADEAGQLLRQGPETAIEME